MPTAGEQIAETIVRLTQENADLSREVERMEAHEANVVSAALKLKRTLEAEIARLESLIESLRGGTHCRFVGVPCGQCVGCNRDAAVERKMREA